MAKNDNIKKLIIVEKGHNKYQPNKMQSVYIKMEVVASQAAFIETSVWRKATAGACRCYIIGSETFQKAIQKTIRDAGLKWQCITKFGNEDEVMKEEHVSFPKDVKEGVKTTSQQSKKEYETNLDFFKRYEITEEDAIGVLMAAEELQEMKIFPCTPQNIYDAFLKLTYTYVQDEDVAKKAVDVYLQYIKQKKNH